MTPPAGYSGTPLVQKLGVKPAFRVKTKNAPANYSKMLQPLPENVVISTRLRAPVNLWHIFSASRRELARKLPDCRDEIEQNGMIWVSWPKKSSGVASDITEDTVRELAFPLGLVDIKVCAVDEIWSGLKLVIRKENRK